MKNSGSIRNSGKVESSKLPTDSFSVSVLSSKEKEDEMDKNLDNLEKRGQGT